MRPFSKPVIGSPLTHFSIESGGALSPTLSFGRDASFLGALTVGGAAGVAESCARAPDAATSRAAERVAARFNMDRFLVRETGATPYKCTGVDGPDDAGVPGRSASTIPTSVMKEVSGVAP